MTGRAAYEAFSTYKNDPKIAKEGALYVAKNYYWEAGAYYWSVFKPSTAENSDIFDLNKKCDENASVEDITEIVNGDRTDQINKRKAAYIYYSGQLGVETETDKEE